MDLEPVPPATLSLIPSYIESLVGLLVFGISIPSILINIPPRIRAIRDQYGQESRMGPLRFRASRLLNPVFVVVVVVLSIVILASYNLPTPGFICHGNANTPGCLVRHYLIISSPYVVNGLLIINIVITALFIRVLMSHTRDRVIQQLGEVCKEQADANKGVIDEELLQSMGELGEFCEPGSDKQSVLTVLEGLYTKQLSSKSWANVAATISQTVSSGNELNVIKAIDMLQEIFRLASRSELGESHLKQFSIRDILREMETVFILAFDMESPVVMAKMMQGYDELTLQPANDAAKAFLRIGKTALRTNALTHAVRALDKLNTQISELLEEHSGQCPPEYQDALDMYFALLAYFWSHGITMRQHALSYLDQLCEDYSWSQTYLNELLRQSGDAMQMRSLETADLIKKMVYRNRQLNLADAILKEVKILDQSRRYHILASFPSIEMLRVADTAGLMACGISRSEAQAVIWQAQLF